MKQRSQRILSTEEIKDLLQASRPTEEEAREMKHPDRDYILLKITVLHGLRNSEARTLKRKHINLEDNQIYIVDSKNGKDRNIPIHPQMKTELRTSRLSTEKTTCSQARFQAPACRKEDSNTL